MSFRRLALVAAAALALLPLTDAAAEEGTLRTLVSAEDLAGVEGIGRIDMAGRAFCTGSLVSPRLVLTAAHCLFDSETGAPYAAEDMSFRAALRNGVAGAAREVRRMVIHPDYVHGASQSVAASVGDLALLELDHRLDQRGIRPFPAQGRLHRGDLVEVVSYARTRAEAPSHEDGCRVLDRDAQLLVLTCDVDFGASGSPVFVRGPAGLQIAGLISAMAMLDGERVAIAVTVEEGLATLEREFSRTPSLPPVRKALRVEDGNTGTIRFLRP